VVVVWFPVVRKGVLMFCTSVQSVNVSLPFGSVKFEEFQIN
jgi:hypothetical protein